MQGSKDVACEKAGLRAGWVGVKKAQYQEYTLLGGQKSLGRWGQAGFCPTEKVPESGSSGYPAMWPLTHLSCPLSTGEVLSVEITHYDL